MPVIRKFLDLSTAHLDEQDRVALDIYAAPGSTVGPLASTTIYGWFMYATDDPGCYDDEALTPHLRTISAYARKHDCDYVLFDCDAAVDPDLVVYDEEYLDDEE